MSSTSETVSELLTSHTVAGVQKSLETMMTMMQKIMDRLDKLEKKQALPPQKQPRRMGYCHRHPNPPHYTGAGRQQQLAHNNSPVPVVCHRCGKEGHYARGCASRYKKQGN